MMTPEPDLPSDRTLVRYLLGALPQDEAELLDERSIADEALADRLRALEHDLADAYARGELPDDERTAFERVFLATSAGREDVRLARALALRARGHRASTRHWRSWLATAAAILVVTAIAATIRRGPAAPPTPQRARTTTATGNAVPAPPPAARPSEPAFVALTLAPPTRSISQPATLTIPRGTREVRLGLRLEPTNFSRYDVVVRDLESRRETWRAGAITSSADADGSVLRVTIPADAFRPGRFAIIVSGLAARGPEIVGTYPLNVDVSSR